MNSEFVKLQCPSCSKRLKIPVAKAEKKIVCPRCSTLFISPPKPAEDNVGIAIDQDGKPISSGSLPSTISAESWKEPHPFEQNPHYNPANLPPNDAELIDTDSVVLESITDESLLLDPKKTRSGSGNLSRPGIADSDYWASSDSATSPASEIGTVSRSKKYQMVQKKSDEPKLTEMDDRCRQGGFSLIVFGIGTSLLPLFGIQWQRMRLEGATASLIGLAIGLAGVGLIAYAMRRSRSEAAIMAACLSLLICGVSFGGYWYQSRNSEQHEFIEGNGSDAPGHLPIINGDDDAITVSNNEMPQRPLDARRKNEPPGNAEKGADDFAPDATQLSSSQSKRNDLRIRASFLNRGIVRNHEKSSAVLGADHAAEELAGQSTNKGKALVASRPVIGLDAIQKSDDSGFQLIVPIVDRPKFEDSLSEKAGHYLAGVNLNIQANKVVGLQGLFAPLLGSKLDVKKVKAGQWIGEATDHPESSVSDGNMVYGIIAYRDIDQIVGVSVVIRN